MKEERTMKKTFGGNFRANYYSEVGSYTGTVKIKRKWIGAKNLNYIDRKGTWIRWQGPPSPPIIEAMKNIQIDGKDWNGKE